MGYAARVQYVFKRNFLSFTKVLVRLLYSIPKR